MNNIHNLQSYIKLISKLRNFQFLLAFQCIANGRPVKIPTEISKEFVKHAEEAVNVSYSHSETFSFVNMDFFITFISDTYLYYCKNIKN